MLTHNALCHRGCLSEWVNECKSVFVAQWLSTGFSRGRPGFDITAGPPLEVLNYLIQRLQYALNSAARLISMSRKADHITPLLIELHWLPVEQHINFKILLFTYKIVNGLAPMYLSQLLVPYVPRRDLRSADKLLFCQPSYRTKCYGSRAFSVSAPCLWNKLPMDIKCIVLVLQFLSGNSRHIFLN